MKKEHLFCRPGITKGHLNLSLSQQHQVGSSAVREATTLYKTSLFLAHNGYPMASPCKDLHSPGDHPLQRTSPLTEMNPLLERTLSDDITPAQVFSARDTNTFYIRDDTLGTYHHIGDLVTWPDICSIPLHRKFVGMPQGGLRLLRNNGLDVLPWWNPKTHWNIAKFAGPCLLTSPYQEASYTVSTPPAVCSEALFYIVPVW